MKKKEVRTDNPNVLGLRGETTEQPITDTLEQNYMPYAMSVIVSRAIPEIDGFKPSHRKLLYTMYRMGLLTGARTKSANIVGQTMRLNPHGDAAIYETMVRLSAGNQALLTPFVDSKGNFGKVYSRDMSYAASRYTEAKLSKICTAVFGDIDRDAVDFTDNYDGSMKEPMLLPTAFPNVLVSANTGIAVGMASQICGFNFGEVCEAAAAILRDGDADLLSLMPAPDFPTGGEIVYDRAAMEQVYRTGRGSITVRSKWRYLPKENIIEITEIPYTATCEAILDKVAELVKAGRLKEINDMRDETDLQGLRLAIDLKRGTDPDRLMQKLFKSTPLQDAFPCNFNILVAGNPRVMGVREILDEWIAWRTECVRRRIYHELSGKKDKLHLLRGLEQILLDIDRAIEIIRNTELESDVVPNLMRGFGIDETQAEFVAEIRLRNINREYILKRTRETADLERDIARLESILNSRRKLRNVIVDELEKLRKEFPSPRRTAIVYADELPELTGPEPVSADPFTVFISREGYFKKISPQSLRMSSDQKLKEGDSLACSFETRNDRELLVFTDRCQAYFLRLQDVEPCKASVLGSYLPTLLSMDEGERVVSVVDAGDYSGTLLYAYASGKLARVPLEGFRTKTRRKKLTGAASDRSELVSVMLQPEEVLCFTDDNRALLVNTSLIPIYQSRSTQGLTCLSLRGKHRLTSVVPITPDPAESPAGKPAAEDSKPSGETTAKPSGETASKAESSAPLQNLSRYRARTLPKAPIAIRPEDRGEVQYTLL